MSDQGAGNRDRGERGRNGRRGGRRPFGKGGQRQDGRARPEEPRSDARPRADGRPRQDSAPRQDDRARAADRGRQRPPAYRENPAQVVPPPPSAPPPDCPLCGKPIADVSSALAEKASKAPAHFDCVLASLAEAESPGPQQRLVYLGSGCFALVEGNPQTPQKFTIVRKIQYEERDSKPDWRKDLNRAIVR